MRKRTCCITSTGTNLGGCGGHSVCSTCPFPAFVPLDSKNLFVFSAGPVFTPRSAGGRLSSGRRLSESVNGTDLYYFLQYFITNHFVIYCCSDPILVKDLLPQAELQLPFMAPRHSRQRSPAAPAILSFLIADLRPIQRVLLRHSCFRRGLGDVVEKSTQHATSLSFAEALRNRKQGMP